jgi:hypothetical protein
MHSPADGPLSHNSFHPSLFLLFHTHVETSIVMYIDAHNYILVHILEPLNKKQRPLLLPLSRENVYYRLNISEKTVF